MELEQLEVLFKANYSDVIQKTQELANLFQNNFGQISSNVQNSLNQMANASNQNAQKVKQDSNDIVNAKRNEASQVNDAANSEHGAFSRISEAFQTLKSKLANNNFDHTFDKLKQSARKVEETKVKVPEVDTSDLNKATRDVLKQVDTINQKMEQARREQAKLQKLMSMRTDVIKTDPESLPKLDAQIDQQRVKMTRYLNQAKSLAQNMREEFNKIPASLDQIAGAMDRNEAAINNQKQLMASLKEKMEYTYDPNQIAKFQRAYDKQNEALERLIAKQDKLGEQYAYTEDKAKAYKKVIDNLDLSLDENGEAADKAGRKNAGLGSRFASLRNMLSGLRSHFSLFGNSAEKAGSRASNGFNRGYRSGLNLVAIGRMLATQILVYQILSQAIMALGSAFFSALKANSQFSASLNQIQVNLLTAFYPIYKTVLPALNALMSALSQATAWIANFVAALTGTSVKANQAGAKALYNQVQAMKDTSSASKSATSAIKKQQKEQADAVRAANRKIQEANRAGRLAVEKENEKIAASNAKAKKAWEAQKKASEDMKNSLMGFDEINVLDKDSNKDNDSFTPTPKKKFTPQETQEVPTFSSLDSGGNAGAGNGGKNGINWNVPINENDGAFKAAKDFKKLMGELFAPLKEAWSKQGKSVIEAAKRAWKELGRAVGDVGHSFKTVWTNGTGEKVVEDLLKLFRTLLNIVGDVGKAFSRAWEDHGRGTSTVQAIFNALHKVLVLLNDIGTSFRKAFNSGVGESIFAHLINSAHNLANIVGGLAGQFDKAWKAGRTGEDIWKTWLGMIDDWATYIDKASASWAKFAGHLNFSPILKSFDTLLKSIRSLGKDEFDGMYWGMTHVLQPLSKWTIEKAAPAAIKALAAALKLVHTVIKAAEPALKWAWDSFLKPIAKWTGKVVVDGLNLLTKALNGLSSWASKHQKLITNVAKVLITWFTFKVSVSAIESATSKFGSLLGIAKELWTKKTVFKDLLDGIGITKIKEIGTNLKTIYYYSKDLVSISWGKIKTAGGYLKTIAGIGWDKVKVGGGYLKTIAGLGWEKIKAAGGYLKTIAGLAWDGLKAGVGKLAELAKLGWSNVKLLAGYMGDLIKLGWSKLIGFVQLLGTGLKSLWVVMAANPIGAVIAAIAALVAIFATLYATNKPFRKWCQDIWGNISKYFGGLGKWFGQIWDGIKKDWSKFSGAFAKSWSKHWANIKDGVVGKNGVWTHLKTQAGKTWTEFTSSLSKWWGKFSPDWKKYWNSVKTHVTGKNGVWEHLKTQSGKTWNKFTSSLSTWWKKFNPNWKKYWASVKKHVTGSGGVWTHLKTESGKTWNHFTTSLAKWWPGFSSSWSKKWNSVKTTLTKAFSSLVKSAGSLGGKIAKAISGGWNAVTSTVGKLANKIIKPIQTVIQKVGQGINWALGKVGQSGFNWSFDWSYHYANGTGGHPGGLALVNDQEGDTYREAFQLPNGQTGLFPAVKNLLMDLPAGTKVMPATQTKALLGDTPHYAGGIGDFDFNFDFSGLNSIASSIGDFAGGVMDTFEDILKDIAHPSKLVEYIISKFVGSNSETASISQKLFDGLKSIMNKKLFGWASDFLKRFGKKEKKKSSSSSSSSSSGNWTAFNKSMANLSKIFSKGFGFENGGLINKEGYYLVGEGNKPEMVIPLTDKIRALALIQKSMAFMGENFKNGLQMPRGLENQISFAGGSTQTRSNNDLTTSIVNAIVQGLQMANVGNTQTAGNNQPINVTIQVDSTKLGEAAIKGINQVNQANGKNMLRI